MGSDTIIVWRHLAFWVCLPLWMQPVVCPVFQYEP